MSLPSLRDLLAQHFDLEELCQLCFDLDIEYENLPGVTRKAKAQALVEYCLRHNCLPGLNTHCRELRPNVNWPNLDNLVTELSKVEQAITAQKALRGILPEEQVRTSLNPLQEKQINLLTQLLGSSSITGSNNNLIIQQFIHIYQEGGSCVVRGELNRAIDRYATWVMEYYGRVPLRGLSDREYQLPDPDLSHVYVSLVAQREGGRRQANRQRLIDMSKLPNQDSFHDYFSQVAQEAAHPQEERQDLADLRNLPNQELLPDFFQQMALEEVVHWQEERQGLVDMGNLLSQGPRLVITGRPGSGKTTFLRYIAYLLGYAIHTGDDKAVRQQLNLEGSLPLPIYVSLADYHRYCQKNRDLTLIDFISHTLIKQHGVYNLPNDFFAKMLSQENTVCLLLDSLDEIPTEDDRFQVTKAILQLAANRSIGHMLVASRDHAYVGRTMLPRPFRRFVVQAMRQEQITALIQRWCKAVYLPHKATDESKALQAEIAELEAIRKAQGEVPLVDTPLMVSIVAIVHYNERKLPQQRAALYEKCVNALLAEQHKGEEGEGQSDLEKRGGSTDAKRGYLALLAYQMMSHSADKDGGRTISIERMRDWLLPEFERNEGSRAAQNRFESFRSAMCDRASILHERSEQIEFTHFTFQEFLCAYYLAVNESLTAITKFFQSKERTQHSWWREAILLTIGYLGKTAVAQSLKLVQNLLSSFPDPPAELAAAELAASGLLELEVPAPDVRRVAHDRLVNLLTNPTLTFPLPLRVQAGRTLSKLGDKRPGVGVIVRKDIKLPDIAWGEEVPVGMYTVGSNKDVDNNDTRKVKIEQPYRLSRYPITNIQFQCFVEAADCYEGNWWQGIPKSAQDFRNPAFPYDNHPRETVSWYQAVAFCRWLSDKLGYDIELPHEYEWEIAARYPDNRFYSWGNKFKIDKTNAEAGIGQTTAVGTYPSGKNETLELYDLSGNVWEQCHNKYQQPEDDAIDQSGARRVVRGGSWGNYRRAVSTVYRASSPPDGSNSHDGFRVVRRFHLKVSE